MSVREELMKLTGVKSKKGEDEQVFLRRLFNAANSLPDADWPKLSNESQVWCNSASEALEANPKSATLPDLPGEPAEAEDKEEEPVATTAKKAKSKTKATTKAKAKAAEAEEAEAEEEEAEVEAKPKAKAKAKAKPAKAAKKAKANGGNGAKRGRPSVYNADAKIKVLVKQNPFREGSNSAKVFDMYKSGMTVADFEKAVSKGSWESTPKMFLNVHRSRGLISVG